MLITETLCLVVFICIGLFGLLYMRRSFFFSASVLLRLYDERLTYAFSKTHVQSSKFQFLYYLVLFLFCLFGGFRASNFKNFT